MAIAMLRGLVADAGEASQVRILDEALEAAVRLSHRYIPARQLPDKAVSLLDTACARVAISQHAMPPPIEDRQRRIGADDTELGDPRARDGRRRADHATRREDLPAERSDAGDGTRRARGALGAGEGARRPRSRETRAQDRAAAASTDGRGRAARRPSSTELVGSSCATLQGETAADLSDRRRQAVAAVVADWTGIPVGRMVRTRSTPCSTCARRWSSASSASRTRWR